MGVRAELPLMQINTAMTVGQGRHARRKRMPWRHQERLAAGTIAAGGNRDV
jgi:hypothetical protein